MRNLCCKCPHYYSEYDYNGDYDWGCRVFGSECNCCPSFWDDEGEAGESEMGCNVHPKQMDFIRMRGNKRFEAWSRSTRIKKFLPHHHSGDKEKYGYKALDRNGKFMGFWTVDCRTNRKGGHTHNHVFNVCHRITFRSKSARHRVSREDKRFFTATFYTSIRHKLATIGDFLKRRKVK